MTAQILDATKMQAVVWGKAAGGAPFALRAQPIPQPGPGEVRLRVAAAALNYSDLLLARGRYALASPVAGIEAAGEIDALGPDVTGWKVGDRVCALSDGGAQADWLCARADHLLPWPERLDAAEAACLPEAMATIWSNLVDLGGMSRGQTLLVHGASGGMGSFAVEAGHAMGLTVIACASASKTEFVRSLGADHVIDGRDAEACAAKVLALTGGHGADLILDVMGGSHLTANVTAAAMDGRIALIGLMGGPEAQAPLGRMMAKRLTLFTTSLRDRPVSAKARIISGARQDLLPLVETGALTPRIARRFPLAEVAQAHRFMESRGHLGKIVLETQTHSDRTPDT
ncbi:NAD(P)H-quinone oxidoreductase [Citreicella sp. C3M06]|uniref:NAD(P)H-quinone oxidoreductase n=1 Tax=Citreicella sp. C3M06 TaxID=2841564 RepID=UPI001C08E98A|nr:NAD(P)H-quinone oxidoreductase [Citreicella sp. C3M06]MBU2960774.1 NAD(P)H-quinone oxidoreductase [Citreicella sp. C3M06]